MEEKMKSTLDKVIRLARQNPEFDAELRKALMITAPSNQAKVDDSRLKHIEKYLGLDYYVDSQNSSVDYSFVDMADVRAQLISDNREMMRFRYGTRYHEIDFHEFCRYAQLQTEMLLNYYYDQKNDSVLADIRTHIKTFNPTALGLYSAKSLAAIPYNVKLWAFQNEYKDSKFIELWNNVREVRNDLSHRSPEGFSVQIEEYQKMLISLDISLNKDGSVNWRKVSANEQVKSLYENKIAKSDDFKRYRYLLWLTNKPFDSIIEGLRNISKIVSDNL